MRQISRFQVTWIDLAVMLGVAFVCGYLCHVSLVALKVAVK